MGLTKEQPGMCSGCQQEHIRPLGSYCKYAKEAVLKCQELGLNEKEFLMYIDADPIAAETAEAIDNLKDSKAEFSPKDPTDKTTDTTLVDRATVQQLLDITRQQHSQIDDIIHHFNAFSLYNARTSPASHPWALHQSHSGGGLHNQGTAQTSPLIGPRGGPVAFLTGWWG